MTFQETAASSQLAGRMARIGLLCLLMASLFLSLPAIAGEVTQSPSARLLDEQAEMFARGRCLRYTEGGAGWIVTEPVYFLQGEVVNRRLSTQRLEQCPLVADKKLEHYSREEFVRYLHALPCVSSGGSERDQQIGLVRLKVERWETPYARKLEAAGRLYRGQFIKQRLEKGLEIEIEADQLAPCPP